jgi:hypothetical protein
MRQCAFGVFLAAVILLGMSEWANTQAPGQPYPQQQPQSHQQERIQTITGKVASVSGSSFSIEVGEGEEKRTMTFTRDANTDVSGELKEGDNVTVEYHPVAGGRNVATKVDVGS